MTMMLNRPEVAVEVASEPEKAVVSMPTPEQFLALDFVGRRKAVMDFIQANPELHDQGTWGAASAMAVKSNSYVVDPASCGTTACLAGWTALFAGARPRLGRTFVEAALVLDMPAGVAWEAVVDPSGALVRVPSYARKVLGLSVEDSDHLFWGRNSLADLAEIIDRVNAGLPAGWACGTDHDDDCFDDMI